MCELRKTGTGERLISLPLPGPFGIQRRAEGEVALALRSGLRQGSLPGACTGQRQTVQHHARPSAMCLGATDP